MTKDQALSALGRSRSRSAASTRDRVEWLLKQKKGLWMYWPSLKAEELQTLRTQAISDGMYSMRTYWRDIDASLLWIIELAIAVQNHKIKLTVPKTPLYTVFVGCDIPATTPAKAREKLRQILRKAAPEIRPRVLAPIQKTGVVKCPVCLRRPHEAEKETRSYPRRRQGHVPALAADAVSSRVQQPR